MTATAFKWEASKYNTKSISILIDTGHIVYVNGSIVDKFLQQFHDRTTFKFQYFGKKKSADGHTFHHVQFLN